MKIIEPLSSALLITACVYVAGYSQNSAFMHYFGINPIFSQPAIDKIFYDGGIITFELFLIHLVLLFFLLLSSIGVFCIAVHSIAKARSAPARNIYNIALDRINIIIPHAKKLSGLALLIYLILLTYLAFEKGQRDGEKLGETFINICHPVIIQKENSHTEGCAFNKDKDSIWYYTLDDDEPKANSKLLSELDQIRYLTPVEN